MMLEEAKQAYLMAKALGFTKRIIREPNRRGVLDIWFVVENTNQLIVQKRTYDHLFGHGLKGYKAPFQTSEHDDWILI